MSNNHGNAARIKDEYEIGEIIYPAEEIVEAYDKSMNSYDGESWEGIMETYTPDAVYVESQFGKFEGREAIRTWLYDVMGSCMGWTYPERWRNVVDNRISIGWTGILPGTRPDGRAYDFVGFTSKVYAGNGQFSYQEDVYNALRMNKVMQSWYADQEKK